MIMYDSTAKNWVENYDCTKFPAKDQWHQRLWDHLPTQLPTVFLDGKKITSHKRLNLFVLYNWGIKSFSLIRYLRFSLTRHLQKLALRSLLQCLGSFRTRHNIVSKLTSVSPAVAAIECASSISLSFSRTEARWKEEKEL